MGVAISGWRLARAVSRLGQLGVVSGTALPVVLSRRLQLGDPGGNIRRALSHFPFPDMATRMLKDYFIPGGKPEGAPFRAIPVPSLKPGPRFVEPAVLSTFVEVFLAKEGHGGQVGINFLEKIQLPTLPSIFGAMLAGVNVVLMGAGIPRAIPGVLDSLAVGDPVEMKIDVEGALRGESFKSTFDPKEFCGGEIPPIDRPRFLAIISSATLAMILARKSSGRVDGFVVEGETAGGHNAPARGAAQLSATGEPVYGERDVPEVDKIRAIGLPFWLAGSYGRPGKLAEALDLGAAGIQVGTGFAFCEESGLRPDLKRKGIELARAGRAKVFTDPVASPTGFPFKVAGVEGSVADPEVFAMRERVCDLGALRRLYRKTDGSVGYRCPAEPVDQFVRKGGDPAETEGRLCVCNGLVSGAGFAQVRSGGDEPPLVTAGIDFKRVAEFLPPDRDSYTAADVVSRLLGEEIEADT